MAKYCSFCGGLIEDETVKFCPNCGGAVAHTASGASEETPVEAPASVDPQPQPVETAPETTVNPDYTPQPPVTPITSPQPLPKVKKGFPVKAVVFAGIAIALVAAIVLNMTLLSGYFIKFFKPDEAYFAYVENKAVSGYTDALVKWYENYLENEMDGNSSVNTELGVKLGELPMSLIASNTDLSKKDLEWINDTKFRYACNLKDDKMSYGLGLKIGSADIVSALAVLDNSDQVALIALKELSDDVLKVDLGKLLGDSVSLENMRQVADALPDAETVRKLANKYIKIALEKANKSVVSSETFEVGDLSRKLTVIETQINEKFLYSAALAVLKEAKNDDEIKAIVKNVGKAVKESGLSDDIDILTQYEDGIDSACETLRNHLDALDGRGEELAIWYDYVDSAHEIAGHKVAVNGQVYAEYVQLKKGSKIASEAVIPNVAKAEGSGEEKAGKRDMTYDIQIVGSGKVTVKLEDYKVDGPENGEVEGIIRILPDLDSFDLDISEILPKEIAPLLSVLKPELKISLKIDPKKQDMDLTVLNSDALLLQITTSSKLGKSGAIDEPQGNVVDAANSEALAKFAEELKIDDLIGNLKKAGVPDSLTGMIANLLNTLPASGIEIDDADMDDILPDLFTDDEEDGEEDFALDGSLPEETELF